MPPKKSRDYLALWRDCRGVTISHVLILKVVVDLGTLEMIFLDNQSSVMMRYRMWKATRMGGKEVQDVKNVLSSTISNEKGAT